MQIPEIGFNHSKTDQAEFEMVELESLYQRNLASNPEKPHRVTFFLLVYIEEGEGSHMVDFKDYPFSSGSFVFIQREQVHAFDFSSKPKGKVLLFTQAFLDQVHANMRLPNYTPTHLNSHHTPLVKLDKENNQRCHTLISEIITEIAHPQSDPLIVMYLFSSLSLILHRLRPETRHDKLSQEQSIKFARFLELLFSHFSKIRDANWYAHQLNTTYKTLNQVCKLATDLTAKQLIDAYTIVEIKRRLVVSSVTTQQMAYDFGFEDASNFVKYFKKHTNFTPSQFQKKYVQPVL
ncbi:helix-turn-helix transcriptional regulator [Photobacterium sagamiensis]|uniref:helix-turn-helix transcriptional regulator n=1 Tax=Photobacterium sagamiensis TaxID=2910241 RepID=UPI003D0A1012